MKKKLAGILAVLMVLSMGTTVFAEPSSNKDSDLKKEAEQLVTTVESGSDSVVITTNVVATENLTAAYEYVAEKIGGDTGFTMLAAVELSTATALPSGGVQITFNVSGLASGTKNVRIYHKIASGWEIKTPYVGNGYVTATFDSLSPFFVVKYDSTPSKDDGSIDSSSIVNNYYNTTNNTYNYTNSNNTNTNSNNSTGSHNTTTTNNTAASKDSSDKKTTTSKKDTTKKTDTKKDTTKKDTTKKTATKKDTSKDSSAKEDNSIDNSNKNTQTVTVNVNGSGSNSAKAGASTSTTSPKTGSSVPALPIIAVFALMGIAVCGKKARNL